MRQRSCRFESGGVAAALQTMRRFAALALVVLLSCARELAPPRASKTEARVRTDRSHYVLRPGRFGPETTIATTLEAPADKTIYVMNCNGALSLGLQRRVGDLWVNAWVAEINGCASAPIAIPPGGRHAGTMTPLSRAEAPDPSQRTETLLGPGTYRAVWHGVFTSFDPRAPARGEELPLEQRVSAPFTIGRE